MFSYNFFAPLFLKAVNIINFFNYILNFYNTLICLFVFEMKNIKNLFDNYIRRK